MNKKDKCKRLIIELIERTDFDELELNNLFTTIKYYKEHIEQYHLINVKQSYELDEIEREKKALNLYYDYVINR